MPALPGRPSGDALTGDPLAFAARPDPLAVIAGADPLTAGPAVTARSGALEALLTGNRRFVAGRATRPRQGPDRVREVAASQRPFAVVLGCADSRVPPEMLFDQGVGDLFDNRVAGNVVDDLLLGSIELAVAEFAPPVVLVLGHERCGAVAAALAAVSAGTTPPGRIAAIVAALRPIVAPYARDPDGLEKAVQANVRAQTRALITHSEIIRSAVDRHETVVSGARYDLDTGVVTLLG
ncbi:carbonic anhydrase [Actinoplanes utahensis]|uniref:carbonic anhydrase n=1 Tax=Actinoplanes utahensis TaxID=1869 RepID=UPI0009FF5E0C|nr:carbonic anhydrase [Actinoplanes utahensis]GIF30171.1 carbonic anhydrase [Actinoplanes utahensis]